MVDPLDRFRSGTHTCKPFRYKRNQRKPKEKPDKTIILGLECARKTPPAPHPRVFLLTGRYETKGAKAVSVCLNQAGNFVALWISKINSEEAVHYVGSGEQPNFILYEPNNLEKPVGWMGPGDGKTHEIVVEFDVGPFGHGGPWKLSRYSMRPTLSDRALAQLGTSEEAKIARRLEHSPVKQEVLVKITEMLTGRDFEKALEHFFEQGDRQARAGH